MSDDMNDLVTEEDIAALEGIEGGDEGGQGGDAPVSVLDKKFGGDPNKLAEAYSHLERKLGEQGGTIGEIRSALVSLIEKGQEANEGRAGEGFLADLKTQVEEGNVDLTQAFAAFEKHIEQRLGAKIDEVDSRTKAADKERIWTGFVADNPEASALEKVMVRIAKAKPHLVKTEGSPAEIKESLNDLLTLAKSMVSRARGNRGSLDGGASRSRRPTSSNNSTREALLNSARETDNERDWSKLVEDILD